MTTVTHPSTAWPGRDLADPKKRSRRPRNSTSGVLPAADILRFGRHVPNAPNFRREPPFLLRGLSYMRGRHRDVPIVPWCEFAALVAERSVNLKIAIWHLIDAIADWHFNRGMAWQID